MVVDKGVFMATKNVRRKPAFQRKTHNRSSMILISIVVIAMIVIVGYKVHELNLERERKLEEIESYEEQIAEQKKIEEEINEYRNYVETDEFVEDVAREKLGLVHEDEIVFIKEE